MGTSMNGDVIQKTADLHQKIDPHHDMGISMNSDVVKKRGDLHQKIDPHRDMGTSLEILNRILSGKKGSALNGGVF